jgi:hypothetical protein
MLTELRLEEMDERWTEMELFYLSDEKQNELVWLNTLEQSFWRI